MCTGKQSDMSGKECGNCKWRREDVLTTWARVMDGIVQTQSFIHSFIHSLIHSFTSSFYNGPTDLSLVPGILFSFVIYLHSR
jgi:hypothetical protein